MAKFYKKELLNKMDSYAHFIYKITRDFPKSEIYGVTSQIRRAAISVPLNYIEGYARRRPLVQLNFYETSYGSLKESKYSLHFCYKEKFVSRENYSHAIELADEIGAMLWTEITSLEKSKK